MTIFYRRIWKFIVAIFAIQFVCMLMTLLRPMLLTEVKLTLSSPDDDIRQEQRGDDMLERMSMDYSLVREQKHTEEEVYGPNNIKILMHNPDICKDLPDLKWIIYVHSAPINRNRRAIIRRTWGSTRLFKRRVVRIVFVIGMFNNAPMQEDIDKEFRRHGDLVQGDFLEDYRNLTLKAMLALKWVSTHCMNARYVLKADDDAFVDVIWLFDIMENYDNRPKVVACIAYSTMPIMRVGNKDCTKWCVDESVFPGRRYYPSYCSGLAFVLSTDLIPDLYKAALRTPTFWIDDVFVTGVLLAQIQGVHRVSLNPFYSWRYWLAKDEYLDRHATVNHRVIHVPTILYIERMWNCLLWYKLSRKGLVSLANGTIRNTPLCK